MPGECEHRVGGLDRVGVVSAGDDRHPSRRFGYAAARTPQRPDDAGTLTRHAADSRTLAERAAVVAAFWRARARAAVHTLRRSRWRRDRLRCGIANADQLADRAARSTPPGADWQRHPQDRPRDPLEAHQAVSRELPGREGCIGHMTRLPVALIAVAALVAMPAPAPAKEVKSATVCGAAGCQSSKDNAAVAAAVENGGPPSTPPRHGAAFYRVTVHIKGDPEPLRLLVAPGIGQVRGPDGTWFSLPDSAVNAWRDVVRGVRPFPAAKLPDVETPAPRSVKGGALPRHTYTVAPVPAKEPIGGTSTGLIAGITAAAVALLALAAALVARRRRRQGPTGPRPAAAS
jgi:hypothetical protein